MSSENKKSCIVCGTSMEHYCYAQDYESKENFAIKKCLHCGYGVTLIDSKVFESGRYYPQSYYGDQRRFLPILETVFRLLSGVRKLRLKRATRKLGKVLDIGCGPGWFLDSMRRSGWSVEGTEVTDFAARHAREHLGLTVHTEEMDFPESFDIVSIWHVLEHVEDPVVTLRNIRSCIVEDGTLLLAVPNFSSLEAKITRGNWFHLDVPRHLHHFSKNSLYKIIENAGFRVERVSFFAIEYDFFSWIQSMQNSIGIKQNLLYKLIKGDLSYLPSNRFQAVFEIGLVLISFPILALSALFMVPIVGSAKTGATITVIARPIARDTM